MFTLNNARTVLLFLKLHPFPPLKELLVSSSHPPKKHLALSKRSLQHSVAKTGLILEKKAWILYDPRPNGIHLKAPC